MNTTQWAALITGLLAFLILGVLNPHLLSYQASRAEKKMTLLEDELVNPANARSLCHHDRGTRGNVLPRPA